MLHSHEGGGNGAFLDLCFVGFVFLYSWRVYGGLNASGGLLYIQA